MVDFVVQFFADADDVDAWLVDTLRIVSSKDVGKDEAGVQSLLKKHKARILASHKYFIDSNKNLQNKSCMKNNTKTLQDFKLKTVHLCNNSCPFALT